jgi:hypothetical protein
MARSGNGRRQIVRAALMACPLTVQRLASLDVSDHVALATWMVGILSSTKLALLNPANAIAGYNCLDGEAPPSMPSCTWLRHRLAECQPAGA